MLTTVHQIEYEVFKRHEVMTVYALRKRIAHLLEHLARFQRMHLQLKLFYEQSLPRICNLAAQCEFMEKYSIHLDRQQKAIQTMTQLYKQAVDQLEALASKQS